MELELESVITNFLLLAIPNFESMAHTSSVPPTT